MRLIVILSLLFGFCTSGFAQGSSVVEHDNISTLMQKFREQNNESVYVKGWRIQIVTTDDRRKMEGDKARFERMYPSINTNWEHKAPYYVVCVGAFRDKRDFQGFLLEVKQDFPSAFPVIDDIRKEELIR